MGDIETIYGWVAVGWRGHDNREAFEALNRLEAELTRLREESQFRLDTIARMQCEDESDSNEITRLCEENESLKARIKELENGR